MYTHLLKQCWVRKVRIFYNDYLLLRNPKLLIFGFRIRISDLYIKNLNIFIPKNHIIAYFLYDFKYYFDLIYICKYLKCK